MVVVEKMAKSLYLTVTWC